MFGNQKLEITFGPWQDIILLIAVFLVIFVYGGAAANMVISEVKSWFGKSDPVQKVGQPSTVYEILWSKHHTLDGLDEQLRISSDIEATTVALIHENGEGFIRYRPRIEGEEFDWGVALWRDASELIKPIYDNALSALRDYASHDVELTNDIFKPKPSNLTLKDFEQDEELDDKPLWVIQWSNNADFSDKMGGELHTFLTKFLSVKIREVMKEHGDGYIRYRASDAEDNDSTWVPNGYVTKEEVTNAKHL